MSRVNLERDADGVAVLQIHDPEQHNALSEELVRDLEERFAELDADRQAKVAILRGLPDVFCAGGPRSLLTRLAAGGVAPTDILLTRALLEVRVPTIAAMEGHAIGGGLTLGLACDLVVMAAESRYGLTFLELGFTPGMGTTRLLQGAVGEAFAAELMYGCERARGRRFQGCPGVNAVVPKDDVLARARSLADRIAEQPGHALDLLKRSLSLRKRLAFEEARTMESMMHESCFARPGIAARIAEQYVEPGSASC